MSANYWLVPLSDACFVVVLELVGGGASAVVAQHPGCNRADTDVPSGSRATRKNATLRAGGHDVGMHDIRSADNRFRMRAYIYPLFSESIIASFDTQ